MKQEISQRISDAILDWRDAESVALYEFPLRVVTKKAPGRDHKKNLLGMEFEQMLAELCQEQLAKRIEEKNLGCRIALVVSKRNFDLDNATKSIWDGLKAVAFEDDRFFDYEEIVRIKADTIEDELISVEILIPTEKRTPWL